MTAWHNGASKNYTESITIALHNLGLISGVNQSMTLQMYCSTVNLGIRSMGPKINLPSGSPRTLRPRTHQTAHMPYALCLNIRKPNDVALSHQLNPALQNRKVGKRGRNGIPFPE